jgi:hypothetical protein
VEELKLKFWLAYQFVKTYPNHGRNSLTSVNPDAPLTSTLIVKLPLYLRHCRSSKKIKKTSAMNEKLST